MSTSIVWCLLVDYWKKPVGNVIKVQAVLSDDVSDLIQKIKEKKDLSSPADDLIVWQSKGPKLLADNDLDERFSLLDFSDKAKISKLSFSKKVINLGLSEDEVLLVQLPPIVSCLVADYWNKPVGNVIKVQAALSDDVLHLTQKVKNYFDDNEDPLPVPASNLVVWQSKEPKLLADDDLDERVSCLDFSDKAKISKLSFSKKVVNLDLSEDEVLLVQLPPIVSCLVVDYWNKPVGNVIKVQAALSDDVSHLIQKVKEKKDLSSPADDLVVWQSKEPKLLIDDDLDERVSCLDFSDKAKISKLSFSKKVVNLGLSEDEVLLVQLPPTVWCLVVNQEPIGNVFDVQAALSDNVSNLIQKVKEKKNLPSPADDLVLWQCKEPKLLANDDLDGRIRNLNLFDQTKISPLEKVVDLGLSGNEVLLVQLPYRNNKRKYQDIDPAEVETELKERKNNRLATIAPSTNGKADEYEAKQLSSKKRIFDDQPKADSLILPISLLYTPFGEFLDIFDGKKDVKGLSEVDFSQLAIAVDLFADEMCKFYDIEDHRRDRGLKLLNRIFGLQMHAASIGSVRSDGDRNGDHGISSMIAEFKLRICGISSYPHAQVVSYFAHSQRDGINSRENDSDELFYGWRIPCLGITVVGCEIRFYALLTLGPRFRIISLTPSISCIRGASDGLERKALHRAFIAATVLHARIDADINDRISASVRVIHRDMVQPYLPAIAKIGAVEIFELESWERPQSYRYLYRAKTKDNEHVIVKFVPQYSSELHRFCAAQGHAPALLAYERLPGGWYGVVMEYLPDTTPISLSKSLKTYREEWKAQLKTLVASVHAQGLVHGDLRDANIICNDEGKVYLIDFDWGGEEGIASYPTLNLHEELLEGRPNNSQLIITQADDIRVLDITLRKINNNVI